MSEHTPGPWYVEDSGQANEYEEPILHVSPENGYRVRPIFRVNITMEPVRKTKIGAPKHKELAAECEANARLIAAAPDLLDALIFMLDRFEGRAGNLFSQRLACTEAHKAIAKATGAA